MFNKATLSQRINAGLALAMVFLLVLATNRIDQQHFETAQDTVNTVFKDRVVAQDYIYRISTIISDKRVQLLDVKSEPTVTGSNEKLAMFIKGFGETKLTVDEAKQFGVLQNSFKKLQLLENSGQVIKDTNKIVVRNSISQKLLEINTTLDKLSSIQLQESKNLTGFAQKSLDMTSLISKLEIVLLIIAGIALQFIIFYRTKKNSEKKSSSMN